MNHLDLSPPYSIEAEQGVLGGLLLDCNTWDLIVDRLEPTDFFRHEHRLLFQTMAVLASKSIPFDIVTIHDALEEPAEAGGLSYLGELCKNTPSVANIEHYASIVRNRSQLRQLLSLGYQCSREATNPQANAADVQESIEQQLFALGGDKNTSEFVNVSQCLMEVVEQIDEHFNGDVTVTGVPSGFADLDAMTSGFQDADLIILGARPSMGKTAFALNCVDAALRARPDRTVQIYSLEMPAKALLYRLTAILGHLDLGKLLKGKLDEEDWPKLSSAVGRINSYGDRLVIDDTSSLTPTALRAKSRRAARRFGHPALILIDYLQFMRCPGHENKTNEISSISHALKALAKEMNCPVVALSQLNRELERRPNKRPINADLRDSGAIEQDADLIMFIYRDDYYHPDTEHPGIAEIIIGKARNGPTGTVRTTFIPEQTRFANLNATSGWQGAAV